ncbi:hypothetical protein [Hyphomicrobium sp. MC8b]|uniref:hypothetical protein n=1 Tax=Hyphomicrobium sp. MC8b TaxID=300273 RepID=UPI003919C49D
MAYHLHRLGISTTALTAAAGLHRVEALHIRNGRSELSVKDLGFLADALRVPLEALTRLLDDGERLDWDFYRVSGRHPAAVWANVRKQVRAAGMSNAAAAQLLGFKRPNIVRAFSGRPRHILYRPPGQTLAEAIGVGDAEVFLDGIAMADPHRSPRDE